MLADKARFRAFLSSAASTPTEEKSGKPSSIEISAPLAVSEISSSPSQALLPQSDLGGKDFGSKKTRSVSTDLVQILQKKFFVSDAKLERLSLSCLFGVV